jgi:hypothetical protein
MRALRASFANETPSQGPCFLLESRYDSGNMIDPKR